MTKKLDLSAPWYKEGLKFQCTGCGKCCSGAPGAVWLKPRDVQEISKFLNISEAEFLAHYTRQIDGMLSLTEKFEKQNYDCVFLKGKFCSIYPVRPIQCQTFPFWPGNLESQENWEALKPYCEGVNDEAPLVSFEEIEKQAKT